MSSIKDRMEKDKENAMRAKDQARVQAIRFVLSKVKQREVDTRLKLDDSQLVEILNKEAKQRRESIAQFTQAQRQDLIDKEKYDLDIILTYLPPQLTESEIDLLIEKCVSEVNATSVKDLGKVMAALKPLIQGRADGSVVSAKLKQRLNA